MKNKWFQAFNWGYKGIEENAPQIAHQGFTGVIFSPCQEDKQSNGNEWYFAYQPYGYGIGNYYGSCNDLYNAINACHANGLKVVMDVVLHHTANNGNNVEDMRVPEWLRKYYPTSFTDITNYNDEYQNTRFSLGGLMPIDLNDVSIQNAQYMFLTQLKSLGVDGVRIDAYKHIIKEHRIRLCTWLKELDMLECSFGECLGEKFPHTNYNEGISIGTDSCSLHDKNTHYVIWVYSHDDEHTFYVPYMGDELFKKEYRFALQHYPNCSIIYYARPFEDLWKSDSIRESNLIY